MKYYLIAFLLFLALVSALVYNGEKNTSAAPIAATDKTSNQWITPGMDELPENATGNQIRYGFQLIAATSAYLGPKGMVGIFNAGMNCQNCHLDAGTRLNANCFAAVAATYPKFRERSGKMESIAFRINECMERSLNGKPLDSTGKEMMAMIAYIKWVGKDVHKTNLPKGTGTPDVPFLNRPAVPENGRKIFAAKCTSCHGADGQGLATADNTGYVYPPLWGDHSFNVSAGIYRIGRLASFIKQNMPYTAARTSPQLTDEEAWDLAAFLSTQQRPQKMFAYDWKDVRTKPVDYPFGPFADTFPLQQHKYGPFDPIKKMHEKNNIGVIAKAGR